MTIFVGLGNHETRYHNTKHNVVWLDSFAKKYGLDLSLVKEIILLQKKNLVLCSSNQQLV